MGTFHTELMGTFHTELMGTFHTELTFALWVSPLKSCAYEIVVATSVAFNCFATNQTAEAFTTRALHL